ncbi:WW domain-containing protein wwm1, partial [Ascosphaera acerosa]
MSFTPPSAGPPPPSVPSGWKAQFDERYKEWYYVDLSTGKSQWEKPPGTTEQPQGPPPSYSPNPNQPHPPNDSKPPVSASGPQQDRGLFSHS